MPFTISDTRYAYPKQRIGQSLDVLKITALQNWIYHPSENNIHRRQKTACSNIAGPWFDYRLGSVLHEEIHIVDLLKKVRL